MFAFLTSLLKRSAPTVAAASVSDTGKVREENQDCVLALPEAGFYCVADGMGGGEGGALASRWTCEALAELCRAPFARRPMAERTSKIGETIQRVNAKIRSHAKENRLKMMGTTLAFLVADVSNPHIAVICHVGDSRIYRWRGGALEQLTLDHTVGGEIGRALAAGAEAQSELLQSRRNPLSHVLTRALGTELRVRPDWRRVDIKPGDRFLLCSDGVHDMLSDATLAGVIESAESPQVAVDNIASSVNYAGAGDNYSAVVLFV